MTNDSIPFSQVGREPYVDEQIEEMPDEQLVEMLRDRDAGDYATIARGRRVPGETYSWDQGNVRAWEAARRLVLATTHPRPTIPDNETLENLMAEGIYQLAVRTATNELLILVADEDGDVGYQGFPMYVDEEETETDPNTGWTAKLLDIQWPLTVLGASDTDGDDIIRTYLEQEHS